MTDRQIGLVELTLAAGVLWLLFPMQRDQLLVLWGLIAVFYVIIMLIRFPHTNAETY